MSLTARPFMVTDRGLARTNNEDSAGGRDGNDDGLLYVVADGLGGHSKGEVASETAVRTILDACFSPDLLKVEPGERLSAAFRQANSAIKLLGADRADEWDAASTAVGALVQGHLLTVANVGDSRAYLVRGGTIEQVSVDHRSPLGQNILTRALGGDDSVSVDTFQRRLLSGDAVVLCTDGLVRHVSDDEIAAMVSNGSGETAAHGLVDLALQRGGLDNITVAILVVVEEGTGVSDATEKTHIADVGSSGIRLTRQ